MCKMNTIQNQLYRCFVRSEIVQKVLTERDNVDAHIVLQLICFLRKIVNHPKLIYNNIVKGNWEVAEEEENEELMKFEARLADEKKQQQLAKLGNYKDAQEIVGQDGPVTQGPVTIKSKEQIEEDKRLKKELKAYNANKVKRIWTEESKKIFPDNFDQIDDVELSPKFLIIGNMLKKLWEDISQKIVLVSNYCETLDIFENLCKQRSYPFIRFDGKTNISTRQQLVDRFNLPNTKARREFVFLLSAKAGGCGLNLIGCSKMILLDPDWNPSNDAQVMGRIWRVGQRRPCNIYRMYAANSIEERILDIQRNKENLSDTVIDGKKATQNKKFTDEVIRNLFDYRENEETEAKALSDEQYKEISAALLNPDCDIESIIRFFDLKITEPPPDSEFARNDFDLAKKEDAPPDSDDENDDEEEKEIEEPTKSGKVGQKRPKPQDKKAPNNKKQKK